MFQLSPQQNAISTASTSSSEFLEGPAGAGKTTAGVFRLVHLINEDIPASSILVLVPQRSLGFPYLKAARQPDLPPGGEVDILTIGGLAQRMTALFWPIIAPHAGFAQPQKPPQFLTLETSQYYIASLVKPFFEQGYFESVKIDRNRILSQIIDNLNKTAGAGIPYEEIGDRLKAAWSGDPSQKVIYEQTQECASIFRQYCFENNLLDFSLQMEVFANRLWPSFICRKYLTKKYRHLIYDNIEEDIPVAHDIIQSWLPDFESALLIYDTGGGFRAFLGADPQSGQGLKENCQKINQFSDTYVISPGLEEFKIAIIQSIQRKKPAPASTRCLSSFTIEHQRFYPQMESWVCEKVSELILKNNTPPEEIVILSPFLSDSLRFSLMHSMDAKGIPNYSHRPSRSLRDEPATRCLIALAKLAHPQWKQPLSRFDLRNSLMGAISGLDLLRADLLAKITFKESQPDEGFSTFDRINQDMQERITYSVGERFEMLRIWLKQYQQTGEIELDIFLSRLFGEILSQPGFGFHDNLDAATVAAKLIESAKKFRRVTANTCPSCSQAYIQMVEDGVVAAQYLLNTDKTSENAVFIAPAYTFLMANRPVNYQFWLDIGSLGWWQRINQPLTHPYVLSRHWNANAIWTDAHEYATNQESLERLTHGLLQRCRNHVYLCTAGINVQGAEERGPLLHAVQKLLHHVISPQDTVNGI